MTQAKLVLVTAALGNQGRLLIPKLHAAGLRVRAIARSLGSAAKLAALGADEALGFDLTDRAALDAAMRGVDTVYHVAPNAHPHETEIGLATIESAIAAGVGHFVYSSVLHPQIDALVQHRRKLKVEEALLEAPLQSTVLQPAHYMQTLQHRAAFADAIFRLTWSLTRRQTLVDLDDVTDVAAKVIGEGQPHFGATYQLCGSDFVTADEISAAIAAVIGRDVRSLEVMPAAVIEAVFGPDDDAARFAARVSFFEVVALWYSQHDFIGNDRVMRWLLGRAPTSFAAFLERDYKAWRS